MLRYCQFSSISDQFDFGKYRGMALADVLDFDPGYFDWCLRECTGVHIVVEDEALAQIKEVFPKYRTNKGFENLCIHRHELFTWALEDEEREYEEREYEDEDYDEDNDWYEDSINTYDRYSGSYAQDVMGYSDDEIDTIFDGDPSAYWNID